MIRWALLGALLAGCFSRPEFTPRDATPPGDGGSDDGGDGGSCGAASGGLTLAENNFDQVVVGIPTGFSVTFADPGSKYPMPIAINVGTEQLIANAGGCGREDQVGIAAFPVYSIAGNQNPTQPFIHPLDIVVNGPAYKQLVSHWTYQHPTMCGAAGFIHGNGQTTWSFYPNGRIVRYDYLQPADNGMFMTDNTCSCIQNTPTWTVTSYFAFDNAMVSTLTAFDDAEGTTPVPGRAPPTPPPPMNPDLFDRVGACFETPMHARAAIRWDMSSEGRLDTRIRALNEIAFVHDLVPGGGPGADDTLSDTDTYGLRTHLFLDASAGAGSCTQLNTTLLRHATSPPVLVEGEQIAVDGLGFYDDTINGRTHTTAVTLHADFGAVDDGWALRIRFPGFRSITTSVPSSWQHESDDTFYIFFPGELDNDAMVTIAPECET